MTMTTFAPATRTGPGGGRSVDARPALVVRAHDASSRSPLRVLIANHQPIVRHGLRALIEHEPDLHVVDETDDGREAVRLARQLRPDVVLIDLSIPTVDGISATRIIRAQLVGHAADS